MAARQSIEELKQQAEQFARNREWQAALELFLKVYSQDPTDMRTLRRLGEILYRLDKPKVGKQYLKELATLCVQQKMWAKAISVNKLILKIDPGDKEIEAEIVKLCNPPQDEPEKSPDVLVDFSRYQPGIEKQPAHHSDVVEVMDTVHQDYTGTPPVNRYFASFVGLEEQLDEMHESMASSSVPLFSDFTPEEFQAVTAKFSRILFPQDKVICQQGAVGNSIYVIVSGVVEVSIAEEGEGHIVLANLGSGEFFGEFGLLTDGRRHATVKALRPSELFEITRSDFDELSRSHPGTVKVLDRYYRERVIDTILAQTKLFKNLSVDQRRPFIWQLKRRAVKDGEVLIREGEKSGDMYFIKSGSYLVSLVQGSAPITLARLGAGDFFGEVALVMDQPRSATVTAKAPGEVLVLPQDSARAIMAKDAEAKAAFEQAVISAAKENSDAHLYYKLLKNKMRFV